MRKIVFPVTFVFGFILTSGCSDPGRPAEGSTSFGRVIAVRTDSPPPMTDAFDNIWTQAPRAVIDLSSTDIFPVRGPEVCSLQVILYGSALYMRATWSNIAMDRQPRRLIFSRDTILANPHYDTVSFDPLEIDTVYLDTNVVAFWEQTQSHIGYYVLGNPDTLPDSTIVFDTVLIENVGFDQDRFAIIWDIDNNGTEKADCRSMCHAEGDTTAIGHRMATTGGGNVDVWHWQAGTTDPIFHARDEFWSSDGRLPDETVKPLAALNYDNDISRPFHMHRDTTDFSGPFLHSGEAIEYDTTVEWPDAYIMPGYLLNDDASGSITDVASFSSYRIIRGRWVVLMTRAMTTGHDDDIDFSTISSGDSVMVTIAVMDNSDRLHVGSEPFYIIFP